MQFLEKKVNKKGQFYFIAALAIVAVLIGFTNIANYVKVEKQTEIYRLKEEILVEKLAVLDYALYSEETPSEIMEILISFSKAYIQANPETNFYFILGNTTNLTVLAYQTYESRIAFKSGSDINPIDLTAKQILPESFQNVNSDAGLILDYNEESLITHLTYEFQLKEGINIYFVISSEKNDEKYITYS